MHTASLRHRGCEDKKVCSPSAESPEPGQRAHWCSPGKSVLYSKPQDSHRLKDSQGAKRIAVSGVLRTLKADRHMALGAEIVDLIRLHLLNDPNQVGTVSEIAVVENEPRVTLMRVLIKVINTTGVER